MGKKSVILASVCGFIALMLSVFGLFILDPILKDFIASNIIMTPETYNLWGANPGATNTITIRNFTFYNLTNPR